MWTINKHKGRKMKLVWSDAEHHIDGFCPVDYNKRIYENGLEGISACFGMSIRRIPNDVVFIIAGLRQVIEN